MEDASTLHGSKNAAIYTKACDDALDVYDNFPTHLPILQPLVAAIRPQRLRKPTNRYNPAPRNIPPPSLPQPTTVDPPQQGPLPPLPSPQNSLPIPLNGTTLITKGSLTSSKTFLKANTIDIIAT